MSEEINSESDKKSVLRSAQYPNITIEEALSIILQIKKSFPTTQFDRDDVASALNRTNISRDIGAAVQYGLVDRTMGQGYKLSSSVQPILNSVTEQERNEAIIECFKTPKLYAELIEKFKGHAVPPDHQLKAILIRYHSITENAAPLAAQVFIDNAKFAGVLNEDRVLFSDNSMAHQNSVTDDNEGSVLEQPPISSNQSVNQTLLEVKPTLLLDEMNDMETFKINLSEKKIAYLKYPRNFNDRDIQILKLQIDALALTL